MNPTFLIILAAAGLFIWSVGAYSFYLISRSQKAHAPARDVQPALRLARQWMAEAQRKMEEFAQAAEQPLGAAQNELLELRLEAGRLPLGVKNLKLARESLETALRPADSRGGLAEMAGIYLNPEEFHAEEPMLVYFMSPLGEMPCLEVDGREGLSDGSMKAALARLTQALNRNPATGGFLYFRNPDHYQACLLNPSWMEGLKSLRLMVVNGEGLTALLASLRLAKDADHVVETFREGIESTRSLTGQSDRMGEALSRMSGHALKIRTVLEGGHSATLRDSKE